MKQRKKSGSLGVLLGTLALGANLIENLLKGKGIIRAGTVLLEQFKISNTASSFKQFWNTKVLLKET